MATHSNILAWEIPWKEEPGRYSPLGRKSRIQLSSSTTKDLSKLMNEITEVWCSNRQLPKGNPRSPMTKIQETTDTATCEFKSIWSKGLLGSSAIFSCLLLLTHLNKDFISL